MDLIQLILISHPPITLLPAFRALDDAGCNVKHLVYPGLSAAAHPSIENQLRAN